MPLAFGERAGKSWPTSQNSTIFPPSMRKRWTTASPRSFGRGRTCECNLAPLCRHHHRCKQAEGWWLEQPEPGVLVWHTPAGRTYTTTPTQYAV